MEVDECPETETRGLWEVKESQLYQEYQSAVQNGKVEQQVSSPLYGESQK
jgi:hypothetical protein